MRINQFRYKCFSTGLAIWLLSVAAQAHEFWLEPEDFTLAPKQSLRANIKVGENLVGTTYAFLPKRFERFEVFQGDSQSAIRSEKGDFPAVNEEIINDGLITLAYVSTPYSLRYGRMIQGKFEKFLKNEGLSWVLEAHRQRGLPETGFTEAYSRFAKSLIKAGSGIGADRALGLELEIVMLSNPYTESDKDLTVKLLSNGTPLANTQLSAFFKAANSDDAVKHTLYKTNAQGLAVIPRPEQYGMMLLSAVHMIEPDAKTILKTGAVWESLWASMTFAIE
ncbi:MAG: DUF4198 domain-containing protein [Thiolinea sp.]